MARRSLFAAALVLLPVTAWAASANPSFYLVNRSTQAINEVYVSPVTAAGWGHDQLGSDTIESGANTPIRLRADGRCLFDLRVVYEDGRSEEQRGVNTCEVDDISFGERLRGRAAANTDAAHDPSFRLVNQGNRDIEELYARLTGTAGWGDDRLGDAIVEPDADQVIHLQAGSCLWDVRFVFAGGRTLERRRIDLCAVTDLRVP